MSSQAAIVCPVLVGRAAELAVIEGLLVRARAGAGQTLTIAGEAGIGKSSRCGPRRGGCSDSPRSPAAASTSACCNA